VVGEEYLLVSQDRQRAERYRRRGNICWTQVIFEPGDTLELASVGFSLPLSCLYEGTDVLTA
jgi:Uma2 family endonuclease